MNKLKVLFLTLLLAAFSAPISAKIVVLNAEVAMLSTQFAQEEFKNLDEDAGFIADRERLELLQEHRISGRFEFNHSKKLNNVLFTLVNTIYKITILLQPFLPESSKKIFYLLKQKEEIYFSEIKNNIKEGVKLEKSQPIFPRFDKKDLKI